MSRRKTGPTGPGSRASRVAEQVRQILSQLILEGAIKDHRFEPAAVTITEVTMSPDLAFATAYVSVFSDDDQARGHVVAALRAASKMLRREVGVQLGLRHSPELRFEEDTSVAYGSKIDRVLKEIEHERDEEE